MKHLKPFFLLTLYCLVTLFASAQKPDSEIDFDNFDNTLMETIIFERINEFRLDNGLDVMLRHEVLDAAAMESAEGNVKLGRVDTKEDIGAKVSKAGGTENAYFLAEYESAKRGKDIYTYQEVADEIYAGMIKSRRDKEMLLTPTFYYTGIGAAFDTDKKRVYLTQVYGGVDVLNPGADKKLRKELPLKYSKKKFGLSSGDDRTCKKADQFNDWNQIQASLELKGNYVYMSYDDLKAFSKLFRRDGDGLAVDFVSKEQYQCGGPNIYDNERPSKGVMTKPYYGDKILDNNEIEGRRPKTYYGEIGKVKKKWLKTLPEGYEMNLVVLQDKSVCKVVTRGYLEDGGIESLTLLSVYPDTMESSAAGAWNVSSPKGELKFKIPFEQGKSDYKSEDIEELLDALNEPKFNVDTGGIAIEAHSSLEGDSAINAKLQYKRAMSIMRGIGDVVGNVESELYVDTSQITTTNGWDIFQEQLENDTTGNYDMYKGMSYQDVKQKLKGNSSTYKELEPLLEKQRYAGITMQVTYDVTGDNEMPYVMSQLKKAIEAKDGAEALRIQRFAIRRVEEGKYDPSQLINMAVPLEAPFVSLIVNQVYLDNKFNNEGDLDESLLPIFEDLFETAPENDFAAFNKYMLDVKFGNMVSTEEINKTQAGINALYNSKISKQFVDAINLEFQFALIEFYDSLEAEDPALVEDSEVVEKSLETIKKIFNIEGASWQNALKLGYIFMDYNDLEFATEIMSPFLEEEDVSEELVFAYISAAANDDAMIFTRDFRIAMDKAKDMNKQRYCDLFGAPYSTFQLLDHPLVKEEYCSTCK
jgi:uncharacterized protein YkwD